MFSAYQKVKEFLVFVLFCLLDGGFLTSEEGELFLEDRKAVLWCLATACELVGA